MPRSTNAALLDFPINLHGIPRKYLKMGGERWYMLEECAKHLPCSGGNVEKQAEWYRPVFTPVLCNLCQGTKDQTGKKLLPRKMTGENRNCYQEKWRERIEVKCKNDR